MFGKELLDQTPGSDDDDGWTLTIDTHIQPNVEEEDDDDAKLVSPQPRIDPNDEGSIDKNGLLRLWRGFHLPVRAPYQRSNPF